MAAIQKKPETLAAPAAEKTVAKAPAKKAPAAKKAPVKKAAPAKKPAAKAPKVKVFVEYLGRQVDQDAILKAVKADWKGETIKSLEVYVKPEDAAVYYVVNGEGAGRVDF